MAPDADDDQCPSQYGKINAPEAEGRHVGDVEAGGEHDDDQTVGPSHDPAIGTANAHGLGLGPEIAGQQNASQDDDPDSPADVPAQAGAADDEDVRVAVDYVVEEIPVLRDTASLAGQ